MVTQKQGSVPVLRGVRQPGFRTVFQAITPVSLIRTKATSVTDCLANPACGGAVEPRPKLMRSMEQAKSIAISVIQKPQHADAAAGNLPSSWGSATPERHLTIGITCAEDNYRLANPGCGRRWQRSLRMRVLT